MPVSALLIRYFTPYSILYLLYMCFLILILYFLILKHIRSVFQGLLDSIGPVGHVRQCYHIPYWRDTGETIESITSCARPLLVWGLSTPKVGNWSRFACGQVVIGIPLADIGQFWNAVIISHLGHFQCSRKKGADRGH